MNELTRITPEGFAIADAYLTYGSIEDTAYQLQIPRHEVVAALNKSEVKRYLDGIYLDAGYRNRDKMARILDKIIDSKLEEAEESGVYTSKDLLEVLTLVHKMRVDEAKISKEETASTTVQIANFGEGNYGRLMDKLMGGKNGN